MSDHPVPFAVLEGKVGILGSTGSGKTFTAIGLVEALLSSGRQTIIVDPTGAYHGVRTAFSIPIFGGRYGDRPITESDGEAIGRAIIQSGASAIVDVSLLLKESHAAARRFMAGMVRELKNAPQRAARYLVIDEADEFMPENASGAVTQLFGDLKWIVRRGRIEGWRVMMVTQRPQDIAKSVLTQCEAMIIHRLPSPQDRKAIQEWVKGYSEPGEAKKVLDTLASLETGEAWIWAPREGVLVRARIPANRSADTSKTPEAGAMAERAEFKPVDMDALFAALELPQVDEPARADPKLVQQRDEEIRALHALLEEGRRRYHDFHSLVAMRVDEMMSMLEEHKRIPHLPPAASDARYPQEVPAAFLAEKAVNATVQDLIETGKIDYGPAPTGRARDVLAYLHSAEAPRGLPERAWAFLAGTQVKKSTWRGYKAALRGYFTLVDGRAKLTARGAAVFADDGICGSIELGAPLVQRWAREIKPSMSGDILRLLLEVYPGAMTRNEIAAAVGVDPKTSTFRGYLAPLNTLELIVRVGDGFALSQDLMEA